MSGPATRFIDDWEAPRCNNCIQCARHENCGICEPCQAGKLCLQRRCLRLEPPAKRSEERSSDERKAVDFSKDSDLGAKKRRGRKKGSTKAAMQAAAAAAEAAPTTGRVKHPRSQYLIMAEATKKRRDLSTKGDNKPRACLGLECINSARKNSKYCSDECGVSVAEARLLEILPRHADSLFQEKQETVDSLAADAHALIKKGFDDMAIHEKKLIGFQEKIKNYIQTISKVDVEQTKDAPDPEATDPVFSCMVCGSTDISLRRYPKHVNDCYERSERAVSYGTTEKTESLTNIYCEVYDKKQKTYCKRFKSICPEHSRKTFESMLKVCGFPLKWEDNQSIRIDELVNSEDPFGQDCCRAEQKCSKHHKWLRTLFGVAEAELALCLYKYFELRMEAQSMWYNQQWHSNVINLLTSKAGKPTATVQNSLEATN
ncbi:unnamed protein product [Caenorhabditis auriculariae]|uniref:CXXC-type zinc finger protein 1 n=1 Tax=Caenorhabditis auriculariae TaxID=2777116 RepID=A0A8S1HJQ6_9PELO|nr:unnamed protein product [Caenorhabditis auriculariae]